MQSSRLVTSAEMVVIPALASLLLMIAGTHAVPPAEFPCVAEGYWPDPEDCTRFHVCVRFANTVPELIDAYAGQCEEGLAYDPLTTACRFTLDDPVCTRGPITCLYPGHWGVLEEAPSIYWVCNGYLQPQFRECPDGAVFNGTACAEAPTTPAPAGPRPPANGVCLDPGVWADPNHCNRYYTCTSKLKLCYHKCCLGYHFDDNRKKCVKGFC